MKYLALIPLLCLLAACQHAPSSRPTPTSPVPGPASLPATPLSALEQLRQLDDWTLAGRIAYREGLKILPGVSLTWHQQAEHFAADFVAPLGQGSLHIEGTPAHVSLSSSDGQHLSSDAPEQLIADKTGIQLPLASLSLWLRGVPDAQARDLSNDSEGLPQEFHSGDWQISVLERLFIPGNTISDDTISGNATAAQDAGTDAGTNTSNGLWLPRKLKLVNGNRQVTVIARDWQAASLMPAPEPPAAPAEPAPAEAPAVTESAPVATP